MSLNIYFYIDMNTYNAIRYVFSLQWLLIFILSNLLAVADFQNLSVKEGGSRKIVYISVVTIIFNKEVHIHSLRSYYTIVYDLSK